MLKRLARRRPGHATIVAYLALFVALGGSAVATTQITGKQIKNSTLTGRDIKNGSITGADLKKNTLTGKQINEAKLATVPSAANAATATNATNATNANTVGGLAPSAFKVTCPAGTVAFADACFETGLRADAGLQAAMVTCASVGRRLPTPGELWAFAQQPGVTIGSGEQTDNVFNNGSTREAYIVSSSSSDGFSTLTTFPRPFRCVAPPAN
jgi:hypothetical protein